MIESIKKSFQILEILSNNESPCGVTELANIMKLDKSTVFRILRTMKSKGYVEQLRDTKKYVMGIRILELSNKLMQKMEIAAIAKPMLKKLSQLSGESTHLAVLRRGKVIYIDRINSSEAVSIHTDIGDHEPVHCTGVGKAILAFLPSEEIQNNLKETKAKSLEKFTGKTLTSISELEKELKKIRGTGFAFDDEELYEGVRCLAAPIKNYRNEVIASLGISGPINRITDQRISHLAGLVVEIALKVSERLGSIVDNY
ncbi:MAG: IclR family transcriptional regulator [Actinomycetia bacterium]|nr:IclR family transcriptional regulator [Actinomycetes bacterium]